MEVVRADRERRIRERRQTAGLYMDNVVLILQWTLDEQELATSDDEPVAVIEIGE